MAVISPALPYTTAPPLFTILGLELNNKLKNYKNLDYKIERLRRNSCIKLHNVSYEKSARSVARCTSVLRTFISFLIKNNKWESHSIRKIESSKFKQRTDNNEFGTQGLVFNVDRRAGRAGTPKARSHRSSCGRAGGSPPVASNAARPALSVLPRPRALQRPKPQ